MPLDNADTPSPFDLIEQVDVDGLRVVTVRAALELDVFTHIAAGHDTVESLRVVCGSGERGMRRLVAALRSLELIESRDGRLVNGPTADAYLRAGADGDVRANYLAWLRNRDHLVEAILDDDFRLEAHDPATWASYARGDLVRWPSKSAAIAATLAERGVTVREGGLVLDVGCGSGVIGFTAIRDMPTARVVSIDTSPVLEVAQELAVRMGVAERADFVSGGVESIPPQSEFDLVLLVHVAQYLADEALELALRRAQSALRSDGRLMLVTIIDDPGTPGFSPNWTSAIEMFLAAPGISLRTPDELTRAIEGAGFTRVERHQPWAFSAFR